MKDKFQNNTLFLLFFAAAAVVLLLVFGRALGRITLLVLMAFTVLYLIYQVLNSFNKEKVKDFSEVAHTDKIMAKVKYCQNQIDGNDREIKVINRDIQELEVSLKSYHEVNPVNQSEAEKLIAAFEKEKDLRQLKIDFFQACLKKLGTLSHNHKLTQTLFSKKESLRKLKEKNIEDIADLESFKSDIAYEEGYLQTIDNLSQRMYKSENLPDAEQVKVELELLTKELREL